MIKITKSSAPSVLQSRGADKRAKHCADYDLAPADYAAGTQTFSFAPEIYAHSAVKEALINAQHGKCCFCEKKVGAEGDVEHFRPKSAVRQKKTARLERPGYYWLAYDWDNLLFACPICNQRHKGILFPLADPSQRAGSHHADLSLEQPLLLNPAETDPAPHIGFRQEVAYAIGGSRRGRRTIEVLGLNCENLSEERRGHLDQLNFLREVLGQEAKLRGSTKGRRIIAEAKAFLEDAAKDSAKFASMAREAAKRSGPDLPGAGTGPD